MSQRSAVEGAAGSRDVLRSSLRSKDSSADWKVSLPLADFRLGNPRLWKIFPFAKPSQSLPVIRGQRKARPYPPSVQANLRGLFPCHEADALARAAAFSSLRVTTLGSRITHPPSPARRATRSKDWKADCQAHRECRDTTPYPPRQAGREPRTPTTKQPATAKHAGSRHPSDTPNRLWKSSLLKRSKGREPRAPTTPPKAFPPKKIPKGVPFVPIRSPQP